MKLRHSFAIRSLPFPALILAGVVASQPAQALTYFWDNNNTTAGFGTAGGVWGTDAFWTTSATGVAVPSFTSTLIDDLNFGSATSGLAAGTVSINGSVSAQSITFGSASGPILLSGGTNITLGGSGNITVNNANDTISSVIDGTAGLTKLGTGILNLTGINTYTGPTILNAGALNLGAAGAGATNGTLAFSSAAILLNSGTFTLVNTGVTNNNTDRLSDNQAINLAGGNFVYKGSDQSATNSSETIGAITQTGGNDIITVSFGGTNVATLTGASFVHTAGNAATLVNGTNLGKDTASITSVGRLILSSAPTLVGTSGALVTGINTGAKNTQIVPFLVGEATSATGGLGTVTGTANTFLTYSASNGLRPLNQTDEFTANSFVTGNNTLISAATTASVSAVVNSLLITSTSTTAVSITSSSTLSVTSGAVLFTGNGGTIAGTAGNILGFGGAEGMITTNSGVTGTITAGISGSGGLTKSGAGALTLGSTASNYTGKTVVTAGTLNLGGAIADASSGTVAAASPLGLSTIIDLHPGTTLAYTGASGITVGTTPVNALSRNINLAGTGSGTVTLGNGTASNNDSNFNWGSIVGTGTGTRTLLVQIRGDRQVASYGGLSDMSDGSAVSLSVAFSSGSSNSNGVLQLRGASTFSGPITLTGGGAGTSPGNLLIGGSIPVGSGASFPGGVPTVTASGNATLTSAGQATGTYANTITFVAASGNTTGLYYASLNTNQTLSGVISGPGQLTMGGTGSILTLPNANTYTGGTALTAGTLAINNNLALQNSALTFSGSATATLGSGVTTPTTGGIAGSGALASVITAGYTGSITSLTLNPQVGVSVTYSGAIADGVAGMILTKTGLGTQIFSGLNNYTGGTTVNSGVLTYLNTTAKPITGTTTVAAGATLGLGVSGASAFTSANVDSAFAGTLSNVTSSATSNVGIDTTNGNFTHANSIPSTTRGFTKLGANSLILSGNNTISGPVTVAAGTLIASGNNTISGGVTVNNAATLTLSGVNTLTGGLTVNSSGTLNVNSAGALGGNGTLTLAAGVILGNTTNAPVISSSVNTQTWNGNVTFGGSALNLGTGSVVLAATPIISIGASGPLTIGGIISGAGGITKQTGGGVLELSGANTYTGTTALNNSGGGGWIRVSGTGTLGTGDVALLNTSFLDITSSTTQNVGKVTNTGGWIQGGTINSTNTTPTAFSGNGYITSNLQSTSGGLTANSAQGLFLSGNNSYGGATTVTNYLVPIIPASLPASGASGTISVANTGILALRTGTGQWNTTSINNLVSNASYTVVSGGQLAVDTSNGDFTYGNALPNKANLALSKYGANNLTLTGGNLYTGATTINRGSLTVGDSTTGSLNGTTGTALTFTGTGKLNVAEAASSAQGMGVLTFSVGDGTVTSTAAGATSTATLSFTSVAARVAGATGNFALATNTASTGGTPNKIVLTQVPTGTPTPTGTLLDRGLFFGGSTYATYDTGGFVRGYTTGDANYVANAGGANSIATGATNNVVLTTAAVTAQNAASINTLSIQGAFGVDMAAGQALTVNGILKTGGNSATISNTGSIGASGGELVIRTDAAGDTLNISAPILLGTVTKTGAGALTLSGANTFTTLRLNAGTLNVNSATALGVSGSVLVINEGTTLDNTSGANVNLNGGLAVTINGSFTYAGTGGKDLDLNAPNSGTFNIVNDSSITVQAGTLSIKNAGTATNAAVTKNGAGTLVWGGNGTSGIRGPLTVNSGVVSCMTENQQDYQSIGNGQVFLGDTTLSNTNNATINFTNSSNDLNPIFVRGGTTGTIAITNSIGSHNFTGPISLANNLTLSKTLAAGTTSFFGVISGTGDLNIGNTGSIVVSSASQSLANIGTIYLRAVNTYSGNTNVNSGTLQLGAVGAIPSGVGKGNVVIAPTATLNLNSNNAAINGLSGTGSVDNSVIGFSTVLTVGNNDQTSDFGGVIKNTAGTMAVTKVGSGTQTLSGANTYIGVTTVSAGILALGNNLALQNSALDTNGAGVVTFSITSPTIGGLTGAIDLATKFTTGYSSVTNLTLNPLSGSQSYPGVIANGAMSLTKTGAGTQILSGANTYSGGNTLNQGTLTVGLGGNLGATTGALSVNNTNITTAGTAVILNLPIAADTTTGSLSGGISTPVSGINTATINTQSARTLTVNQTTAGTYAGVIAGAGSLTLGSGSTNKLTLTGTNTYTGATTVDAGTLAVTGAGSFNSSTSLTVAGGAKLVYSSTTALTVAPTLNGTGTSSRAVLGGTGPINAVVTLNDLGDTLSPGNSPGIQSFQTGQTWSSFSYDCEMNNFVGNTAGTDYDRIGITGGLTLSGGASSYILNVLSLTGSNAPGNVVNFSEINRSWNVLTTSTGITGFNAANWTIDTTGFTNPDAGAWSLGQTGNDLVLTYAAVPEPAPALLGVLGALMLLRRRRA